MNAQGSGPTETWPVAQQSALAETTPAVFIGDLPGAYAYAIIPHYGEIDVLGFPDRESLHRALAAAFTHKGKWKWPQSWDRVFIFGPDEPPRCFVQIEDEDDDEALS